MRPRPLKTLATGSSASVGELCTLTAMFTSTPLMEQMVFVRPRIVYLILGSVCPHGVLRRTRKRPKTGYRTFGEARVQTRTVGKKKRE